MYRFVLYCINRLGSILDADSKEKWISNEGYEVLVTSKELGEEDIEGGDFGSDKVRTFYYEVGISPKAEEKAKHPTGINRVFIRPSSNLMLVDIKNNFQLSLLVIDELCDRFELETEHLIPSDAQWISFLEEGELLEALAATSRGLEDISQHNDFAWGWLKSNTLISATVAFNHKGQFEAGFGQGHLFVDTNRIDQLQYVFTLVEEHLLRGNNFVESHSTC